MSVSLYAHLIPIFTQIPMDITVHLSARIQNMQIPPIEHVKQIVRLCSNIITDVFFTVLKDCLLMII